MNFPNIPPLYVLKKKRQSYKGNGKGKRKQHLEEKFSVLICLQTMILQGLHTLLVHCKEGALPIPKFCYNNHWYVDNTYLIVHVYASSPVQKCYINTKFMRLYIATFNQAIYPFNSDGKMGPIHRASDTLYLDFKHL